MAQTQHNQSAWSDVIDEQPPFAVGDWYSQAVGVIPSGEAKRHTQLENQSNQRLQQAAFVTEQGFVHHHKLWSGVVNTYSQVFVSHGRNRPHRNLLPLLEQIRSTYRRQNRENIEAIWLRDNSQIYAGQWIALLGDHLVANSPSPAEVFAIAKAMNPRPLVVQIKREELPFAGW